MYEKPYSTIDIEKAGSKPAARQLFFADGGATIIDKGHKHIYTLHPDNGQVTDMKVDEAGEVVSDTVKIKTVTREEAFDLFWIMANHADPKQLIFATIAAITIPHTDAHQSTTENEEPASPTLQ